MENFIIFTTFVKGFRVRANAVQCAKIKRDEGKRPILFEVCFLKKVSLEEELDYGYILMDKNFQETEITPSILFNIFNVF